MHFTISGALVAPLMGTKKGGSAMENYEELKMEVIIFETEDVIDDSNGNGEWT